jgi:threonine aldolase
MDQFIDLRSDTVTKPTPAMRRAMFEAEVGDDVYGEDPTVNRLEERAAEIVGKEAALFVPTGTMGNQTAIRTHTRPGHEIICDDRSHIVLYEMGGPASLANCLTRTIATEDGVLSWDAIGARVRGQSDHFQGTGLISIEDSHNVAGGRVYPQETVVEICEKAHAEGVSVHMDGARIFNAAAYLGATPAEVSAPVDSVMFCLSKGLGAPVGSMLAGKRDFIDEARRVRKGLGGGMRQVGVLAAAGLVALEESPAKIPDDHANARYLAESLVDMPGVAIDPALVETNILFFDCAGTGMGAPELSARLKGKGVLANGLSGTRMRLVTHQDVSRQDCETAVAVMRQILIARAA